jgi:hypothetical protein
MKFQSRSGTGATSAPHNSGIKLWMGKLSSASYNGSVALYQHKQYRLSVTLGHLSVRLSNLIGENEKSLTRQNSILASSYERLHLKRFYNYTNMHCWITDDSKFFGLKLIAAPVILPAMLATYIMQAHYSKKSDKYRDVADKFKPKKSEEPKDNFEYL